MGFTSRFRFSSSRLVRLLLASALAAGLLPLTATSSQALYRNSDYIYSVANNEVTLEEYVGDSANGEYVFPTQVDGMNVTALGEDLFFQCSITSTVIPITVKRIGYWAFKNCALTAVTIPASVTYISGEAFLNNNLRDVTFLGNAPTIFTDTFRGSGNAQLRIHVLESSTGYGTGNTWMGFPIDRISPFEFTTSDGVATITSYLPAEGGDLVIPETLGGNPVVGIAANVFGFKSLTSVSFPASLTSIGAGAFAYNAITDLYFSGNAPTVGSLAFFQAGVATAHVTHNATGFDSLFEGFVVERASAPQLSNDATLSGLEITPATTLTPAFPALALQYAATVGNSVTSITVKATASESHATITVNGLTVSSGSASQPITLTVGANPINIVTVAQDGSTTFTYTLTVTRLAADLSSIKTLSAIEFPAIGTYGPSVAPTFAAATTTYSATVPFSIKTFKLKPTVTDTGKATVAVNGVSLRAGGTSEVTLSAGDTAISVVVTAQDQSTKTYTINVHQNAVSRDATLSNLQVTGGSLVETFSANRLTYTLTNISSSTTEFFFKPYLNFDFATVKVDGQVTSNKRSNPTAISIPVGTNKTVNVVVTAEDGTTTKTYSVTVTRKPTVIKPTIKTNIKLSVKSGTLKVGSTLLYSTPEWNGSATNGTSVQWYRCKFQITSASTTVPSSSNCSSISGATGTTYKLSSADKLKYVLVVLTVRNSAGTGYAVSPTTPLILQ